jgi:3',5'-cyclic AMP phosphodiesterase CpdA
MSSILHLSDLHLGEPEAWQHISPHKSTVAGGDGITQKDVLGETIEQLKDTAAWQDLTAVVVSGDLTNQARADGFAEFQTLLKDLRKKVGARNVLIVPGNHDVPKEHGPDDPHRYDEFLSVTRKDGVCTPLLDGIDFDTSGRLRPIAEKHLHVVETDRAVIIPINSSHFCWGQEFLSGEIREALEALGDPKLMAVVEHLRSQDVARVSNDQLIALPKYLAKHGLRRRTAEDRRVRIAVLHHQLLPVGTREEMKAFESLTNLGAVRAILRDLEIDVVLHGHKHDSALYWDYVPSNDGLDAAPHRMLVIASSGEFKPSGLVARVLAFNEREYARDVTLTDVVAPPQSGGEISLASTIARLWQAPEATVPGDGMLIKGGTVSQVYAKLRSLLDSPAGNGPLRDVVCEIRDPHDAGTVPQDYPEPPGVRDVQRWMTELIAWWQKENSQLLDWATFNHGERIYRRWGDQAQYAADTLASAAGGAQHPTTRALIVLFDPVKDTVRKQDEPETPFPSFVLVQLQIVREKNRARLDCTGYFRKQEMHYWWPVNVAELALVQKAVLKRLPADSKVFAGRLRTITAFAESQETVPAVTVPFIDRAVDQNPVELWELASGVAKAPRAKAAKQELRNRWEERLSELDPVSEDTSNRPRISYRGIGDIALYLRWLGAEQNPVGKALARLARLYRELADDPKSLEKVTATIEADLQELRGSLDELLGPATRP